MVNNKVIRQKQQFDIDLLHLNMVKKYGDNTELIKGQQIKKADEQMNLMSLYRNSLISLFKLPEELSERLGKDLGKISID